MKIITLLLSTLLPFLSLQAARNITLSASATIVKPSDELQLKIGIITLGTTAQEALAENSDKMQNTIDLLSTIGLTKDDYETSHFSIHPTYTPYPKDPPSYWKQSINGYEVTNTLLVRTSKLDMAGTIIDLANRAGANSITDIQFGLHNPRDYWPEALAAAGSNAIQDAEAIAAATGVQLARVLSITLNRAETNSPQLNLGSLAKYKAPEALPPIEPGETSITANITLVYEIN